MYTPKLALETQFRLWFLYEGTGIIRCVNIFAVKQVADLQRAIKCSAPNRLCEDINPLELVLLKVCNCVLPLWTCGFFHNSTELTLLMSPRLTFLYNLMMVTSMNGGAQITLKSCIQCNRYVEYGLANQITIAFKYV